MQGIRLNSAAQSALLSLQKTALSINDTVKRMSTSTVDLSSASSYSATFTSGADALNKLKSDMANTMSRASSMGARGDVSLQWTQSFTDSLAGALGSTAGALVDADLSAESARLQSLQTQQQLGVQSLSIANQAPQSLLALFR